MEKRLILPGWFTMYQEACMFLDYYNKYRNEFFEDRIIDSFYDCPSNLLWNGGRVVPAEPYSLQDLTDTIKFFRDHNVNLRYTFTNTYVQGDMVKDYYCNLFVKRFATPEDAFIVASDDLFNYLKTTYPDHQFVHSTTKNIVDIDTINELTKDDIYVMNYNYNNNDNYINKLTHLNNIEILCAEPCNFNCPYRAKHYDTINRMQSKLDTTLWDCPYNVYERTFSDIQRLPTAISNDRLDQLAAKGIRYFKISGRAQNPMQYFDCILYYTAKPEYHNDIKEWMQVEWFFHNH